MRRRRYAAAALCGAVALMVGSRAAIAAPIEAYGRLPSVERIALSPDGSRIALVVSAAQNRQLQIRNTGDMKLVSASPLGNAKVGALNWASPDKLILVTAMTTAVMELSGPKSEWWLPAVLDLAQNKARPLLKQQDKDQGDRFGQEPDRINAVLGAPWSQIYKGKPVAIMTGVSFVNNRGVVTIFREGLDGTPKVDTLATGTSDTRRLLVDASGQAVAREDYDQKTGDWSLWTRQGGGWQLAHKGVYKIDKPSLIGIGHGGSTALVLTEEADAERYREVTLGQATWSEPIASLDNAELFEDHRKGTIGYGCVPETSGYRYIFFDPAEQQLWDKIARAFPGEVVRLASWSDDRTKVILRVEGQKSGAAYYLLDRTTNHAEWIADEYDAIPPEQIAEVRSITYRASDGLEIPAYLTLPNGVPTKNLPLVALVHGGPEARDDPGFDWWAQALASMGYAVLQPQFRGSGGYTVSFTAAGYGQFGRKMQTDVSDGVRYLADQGIVDPAKVCIAGASYGGYAAMAGVTLQSGIYRCAVAVAGIADLRRHLNYTALETGGTENLARRYWLRFIGAKDPGDPVVGELSPARHADRLSVPLLLIHGSIDTVVEPAESRMMLEAAQKAGKNVQLVTLNGEDHNLARSETRLQMLEAMATFLRANLPTGAPATQTAGAKP